MEDKGGTEQEPGKAAEETAPPAEEPGESSRKQRLYRTLRKQISLWRLQITILYPFALLGILVCCVAVARFFKWNKYATIIAGAVAVVTLFSVVIVKRSTTALIDLVETFPDIAENTSRTNQLLSKLCSLIEKK